MIIFHKYEGKDIEALKKQCLEELNENIENLYITSEEIELGLFKGKKYILESISKNEIKEYIKSYINELSNNLNIKINCEIRFDENTIKIMLLSDNNNIIIGSNGKNLDAIQILLRQACKNLNKFGIKIIVDASNYKNKKEKNLQREIKNICKEIINTKVEVKLDPMNSYQRRLVHSIVSEFENLESVSYGEDPQRYTVIKYKE
jgi:spoIIIJ-associated protein